MWHIKKLNELSGPELFALVKLRIDTFVVGQKRIYHELDEHDIAAIHLYFQNEKTGAIEAYARIFEYEGHVTFGRVVTAESAWGTGRGTELMTELLKVCHTTWPDCDILIESQEQVVGFYQKFGFEISGEPFIFEGTPHVEMRLSHEKNS